MGSAGGDDDFEGSHMEKAMIVEWTVSSTRNPLNRMKAIQRRNADLALPP